MAAEGKHMPSELARIAASVTDYPTIAQIDEMLSVLSGFPPSAGDRHLSDSLLDMRQMLTTGGAPVGSPPAAAA